MLRSAELQEGYSVLRVYPAQKRYIFFHKQARFGAAGSDVAGIVWRGSSAHIENIPVILSAKVDVQDKVNSAGRCGRLHDQAFDTRSFLPVSLFSSARQNNMAKPNLFPLAIWFWIFPFYSRAACEANLERSMPS